MKDFACVFLAAFAVSTAACDLGPPPSDDPPAAEKPAEPVEGPRPVSGATETTISGSVVETVGVPSYTYLLIDTGKEKVWAAVPTSAAKVGDRVTVEKAILMRGYRSTTLKRDFDRVYFGTLASAPGSAAAAHGAAAGSAAPAPDFPVKAARAPGKDGKTIEELFRQAKKLEGKPVSVRGVVVKSNPKILGKTWIHLRDGSGSETDKTHDLTVTLSQDETPKVGDTVIVHGTIATDRDVGSGYKFAVLLEGTRLEASASAKK